MEYRVLVPVKSLQTAKSRLSEDVSSQERQLLVFDMLDHVLGTLQSVRKISHISVVTSDKTIMQHIKKFEVTVIKEVIRGHNPALQAAAKEEKNIPMDGLLTISADLPLLRVEDIQEMIVLLERNDIVLAPSKEGTGTNAIFSRMPLVIPYLFGENSFALYKKIAEEKNLRVGIYKKDTIAFDVDTIADYKKFKNHYYQ